MRTQTSATFGWRPGLHAAATLVGLLWLHAGNAATGKGGQTQGIAFARQGWVFHLPAVGEKPLRLTQGDYPALSPDGKRIAYCSPRKNSKLDARQAALMVVEVSTRKVSVLVRPGEILSHPVWSPQGDRLAFLTMSEAGQTRLKVVGADGSDHRQLLSSDGSIGFIFEPTWAVDGESVFCHDIVNLYHVSTSARVLAKTSTATLVGRKNSITSANRFVPCPTDSNLIAFTQSVPGTPLANKVFGEPNTALFTCNLKTKGRKRLTPVDLLAITPTWSRDGRYLYFCGYRDRQYKESNPFRLYRVARDGTGLREICRGENPSQ